MRPALRVLQPGLQTTVQDLGRYGHQRLGIPVSGALDAVALSAGNSTSAAIRSDGSVVTWGLGSTLPVAVPGPDGAGTLNLDLTASSFTALSPMGLGRWGERVENTPRRLPLLRGGSTMGRQPVFRWNTKSTQR